MDDLTSAPEPQSAEMPSESSPPMSAKERLDDALFSGKEIRRVDVCKYKCPNCGADISFDPTSQDFSCEFCLSHFSEQEVLDANEQDQPSDEEAQAMEDFAEHTNLYVCSTCGAQIMADDQQTATFCYYCHEPVILQGRLTGDFKPNKVIGFKITRDQAIKSFKSWCSKKRFIPNDFKSEQQLEKMTGLYVPFWVADCDIKADYQGIGKKLRSWSSGNYRYTETKEYRLVRDANVITHGIPADGETKIDDLLMESIEPFNYKDAKAFSMAYLSGFFADKYDVDKAAVFPRIQARAAEASKNVIKSSISGYSSVSAQSESHRILNTKWQYMMLPVWFMTYKYNDKMYEFAINGQTGKLAGTPPLDRGKLKRFCAGIGLAIAAVITLIGGMLS